VRDPRDVGEVSAALERLLSDHTLRESMAVASRQRALAEFDYEVLSTRLATVLGVSR
jgi:glycosyltransferase involved in cell wall biosynthesis